MPGQARNKEEVDQEVSEYLSLGLTQLAFNEKQSSRVGRQLTQDELTVWAWRYPTVYTTQFTEEDPTVYTTQFTEEGNQYIFFHDFRLLSGRGLKVLQRPWADLEWPIPLAIRQLIHSERSCFDALEIWVPELRRARPTGLSPILIGLHDSDRYLLARWAEALEPFEEIRQRMLSRSGRRAIMIRNRVQNNLDRVGPIILGCLTTLGVVGSGLALGFTVAPFGFIFILLLSGSIASGAWRETWLRSPSRIRWACNYAGWVLRE